MTQKLTSMTLEFSPATAKKLITLAKDYDETPAEYIKRLLKNKKPQFDGKPIEFLDTPGLEPDKTTNSNFTKAANGQCQCDTKTGHRCTSTKNLKPVHTGKFKYMACTKHINQAEAGKLIRPHRSSDSSLGGQVVLSGDINFDNYKP